MEANLTRRSLCTACIGTSLLGPVAALAQARHRRFDFSDTKSGDVRLFVSGALRAPLAAVRSQAEAAIGHPLATEVGESREMEKEMVAGVPFDAALVTGAVIDAMIAKGRIVSGSRTDLAAVRVGVAVRGDAPKLDIAHPQGLRKAILGATYVRRFYGLGASVPTLDKLFKMLDLNQPLKDKVVALGVGRPAPERPLAPDQYAMIINLASEIIPMKGWTYLGIIPEQYQIPVILSAGIGSKGDSAVAKKLITFLQGPAFSAALKRNGMTRK